MMMFLVEGNLETMAAAMAFRIFQEIWDFRSLFI
jgi:hypothetical protein